MDLHHSMRIKGLFWRWALCLTCEEENSVLEWRRAGGAPYLMSAFVRLFVGLSLSLCLSVGVGFRLLLWERSSIGIQRISDFVTTSGQGPNSHIIK